MAQNQLDWKTEDKPTGKPPLSLDNVHVGYATRRARCSSARRYETTCVYESLALIGESGSASPRQDWPSCGCCRKLRRFRRA
jgi:hypothetical protein